MIQDMHQVSTPQIYPLGLRYALDDRVFRYARAGGVLTPDWSVKDANFQTVTFAIVAPAALGAKTVVVTVQATDGILLNGAIAANELAGGYCVFFPAIAGGVMNRLIKSNTAVVAPGGAMTVVIDKPLTVALTAVSRIECMASPYSNVQRIPADSTYCSTVGVPTVGAILGQHLWLQTWGPLWTNADLVCGVGVTNRLVKFGPDGNLHPVVAGDAFNSTQGQIAGHVMVGGNAAGHMNQGAPFIFLQITP